MSIPRAFLTASVALALTSVTFFTTSASGQTPPPQPNSTDQKIATAQGSPDATAPLNTTPAVADSASTSAQQASGAAQTNNDRYRDGIIIWETPADAKVPFLLRFNVNTQIRYLNTQNSDDTYTDHLGVDREVHVRNDITVNRAMFILGGYIFDQRARYSFTVWTSAGAASIIVASNIGWTFNKALGITGGYTGVPGSRSLVNTFPFLPQPTGAWLTTSSVPGSRQGVWANGEPAKGLNYLAFVGNGLNTLSISANKIDTHLLLSGSVWWEPLGPYGEPGKSRNMYDDYFASDKVRIRLGTCVYKIPGGPFFKSRPIESREHVTVQFRRRAFFLDRSVCARCNRRPGDVQDVGDRRRHQMERACGQRAILHALAE